MIDPKYADLPGIAYDQPDVYETEDLATDTFQDCTEEDNDSIEKIYVNTIDAFHKFKDKHLSSVNADFSNSISTKKKTGYNVSGEWEHSYYNENETPLQKFTRIKLEIQELFDQIKAMNNHLKEKEEPQSLTDLMYEIDAMGRELDALSIDKLLNDNESSLSNYEEIRFRELLSQIELFKQKNKFQMTLPKSETAASITEKTKEGILKYQMIYFPDKSKIQDLARISHLERRLGYLETIVGVSNDNSSKCSQIVKSQGITKSIEKLMANACLLNSTQLDVLENKVTSLIYKTDTLAQKKISVVPDPKKEKMVWELYHLVKQSEYHSQILPQIIDRLLSLSNLHKKAVDFINQLKELEKLQEHISTSLEHQKILLEGMQSNFSKNLEIVANDIGAMSERIKRLQN
ncbi:dynactin subunit 2 isoform X2 [Phymastichus coffea]|uniref:dynactin subunit 2 isoform X2 n=1 Tax=Phymastichus coffea TaxID=108790 RepID=UPI00273C14FE|nr:dynactin subunit 2 isoform X2 [Phymastichus coffea]